MPGPADGLLLLAGWQFCHASAAAAASQPGEPELALARAMPDARAPTPVGLGRAAPPCTGSP
ncbi:MAG TPA: hypothetical protein VHI72_14260, partial [Hyphomicrobiaceae bacterium]|nr:hypothetical protein [Hyphomicrobiaceae bacterium]